MRIFNLLHLGLRFFNLKVPNLRFPGFEGEWEVKRLGEFIEFKAGYAFKSEQMLNQKSVFQLLKMSNIYQNELRLDRNPSFWLNVDSKQREFLIKEGDTVLTLTGTVGKRDFGYSVQITESNKYLLNQRLVLLREKKEKSTNDFIKQLISIEKFLCAFFNEAKGGTGNQANVGIDDIKKIPLSIPSILEQQKIATFLSLIDHRIQTQNKIIKELNVLKTTLAKKIFSQKLRFKDENSNEFPKWENKKLGQIGEIVNGLTYSPNDINDKGILVLRSSNIQNRNLTFDDNVYVNTTNYNPVKENDILICVRNGSKNLIGKNALIKKNNEGLAFGAFMSVYRSPFNQFIFQWLDTDEYKEIVKRNLGATINSINGGDLKKILIHFPSIYEQTKIAEFLSSIDSKIDIETKLLQKLEEQKIFLLQQMFI